jgi:hypothetical protein
MIRRLSVVALTLALFAGNAAVCGGWSATAEARMACCSDDGECSMHNGESGGTGSHHRVTQVQADSCCAASERGQSSESSPALVAAITSAVLGTPLLLPASIPAFVLSDAWRTAAPTRTTPVPKHVLLSVFLV